MVLQNMKRGISDYDFVKGLISTIVLNGYVPIFDNKSLLNDLSSLCNSADFSFLFKNVYKYECENGYCLSLDHVFEDFYSLGILYAIQDGDNLKSVITLSKEEAFKYLENFEVKEKDAIFDLVYSIYNKGKVYKPKLVLIKGKKN